MKDKENTHDDKYIRPLQLTVTNTHIRHPVFLSFTRQVLSLRSGVGYSFSRLAGSRDHYDITVTKESLHKGIYR